MQASTRAEIRGDVIDRMLEQVISVFRRQIEESLERNGIDDLAADEWYPVETFAEVLADVRDDAGASTARKLGASLPAGVASDESVDSPEDALRAVSDTIGSCHRGRIGDYSVEEVGDSSAVVVVDTDYPCPFDQGILKGAADHAGVGYVRIDDTGAQCRDDGGRSCTYEVSW